MGGEQEREREQDKKIRVDFTFVLKASGEIGHKELVYVCMHAGVQGLRVMDSVCVCV